jgi:hypothetical protein
VHRFLASVSILIFLALSFGCAPTRLLTPDEEGNRVLARLTERRDSIQTALYRVRWRAIGTEPHAEFILEIAYQAPDEFRIVATGPFGLPAFTAVVLGDEFTFVNHHDGKFITDDMANLIQYDFPVAEFFEGPWRDLFAGGWGGSRLVNSLERKGNSTEFRASTADTAWKLRWNRGANAPGKVSATVNRDHGQIQADVWFEPADRKEPPFWKIDHLTLKGVKGEGEHSWTILSQRYNEEIPERFFVPLQPPPAWQHF